MSKSSTAKSALILLARIILGGVFVYASVDKIMRPGDFAEIIANYRILPHSLVNPVAVILPWLEILVGMSLIVGIWVPGAALTCNVLLGAFSLALAISLFRGLDIECGCFRVSLDGEVRSSMVMDFVRDGALLGLGIYLLSQQLPDRRKAA